MNFFKSAFLALGLTACLGVGYMDKAYAEEALPSSGIEAKDLDKEISNLEFVFAGDKHNWTAANDLTLLYYDRGDYKKAYKMSQKALKLYEKGFGNNEDDDFFREALVKGAAAAYNMGEYGDAKKLLNKMIGLNLGGSEDNRKTYMGWAYYYLSNIERVRGSYDRAHFYGGIAINYCPYDDIFLDYWGGFVRIGVYWTWRHHHHHYRPPMPPPRPHHRWHPHRPWRPHHDRPVRNEVRDNSSVRSGASYRPQSNTSVGRTVGQRQKSTVKMARQGNTQRPQVQKPSQSQVQRPQMQSANQGQVQRPQMQRQNQGQVQRPQMQSANQGQIQRPQMQRQNQGQVQRPQMQRQNQGQVQRPQMQRPSQPMQRPQVQRSVPRPSVQRSAPARSVQRASSSSSNNQIWQQRGRGRR